MTGLIEFGLGMHGARRRWPFRCIRRRLRRSPADVDLLYYFLTALTLFFTALIFGTIFFFMIKYRRRSADEIPPDTRTHLALELTWTIIPTLICVCDFRLGLAALCAEFAAARVFDRNVRGRQAVDVAHPASGGRARNQRNARAGGRAGQADHDLGRRDPRFLHSGVPREEGCDAGPVFVAVVSSHRDRHVSPFLRTVLRHGPFAR